MTLIGLTLVIAYFLSACTSAPTLPTFQSPQTTPTRAPPPLQTPKPSATPMPTVTSTPTVVPTSPGPLPTGVKVVYAENLDGTVTFWAASAADPAQRRILTTAGAARFGVHATLSHDESLIAYTFTNTNNRFAAELWVVRVDGTNRRLLASDVDVGRYVNYPIWSPNSRYLAFARQSAKELPYTQTVAIVDVQTGMERALVQQAISSVEDEGRLWTTLLNWSPDGRYLYYQVGTMVHNGLWRVDVLSGSRDYIRPIPDSWPRCYFLSPDGQWLLCTVLVSREPVQYAIVLVPTGSGQARTLIDGVADGLYSSIWNPNGQEIAVDVPAQGNAPVELRAINIQTQISRTIALPQQGVFVPDSWSPDGQWIAAHPFPGRGSSLLLISQDGAQIHHIWTAGGIKFVGWITGDLP